MMMIGPIMLPSSSRLLIGAITFVTLFVGAVFCVAAEGPTTSIVMAQYEGIRKFRVSGPADKYQRSTIAQTGAAIENVGKDFVDVYATYQEYLQLSSLGAPFKIGSSRRTRRNLKDFPVPYVGYHTYEEMTDDIKSVATEKASITKLFSIGKSLQGRDIWAMRVSNDPQNDQPSKPEVLFVGLHHAREHITVEMTLFLLHLLVDNYGKDDRLTKIVDSSEIIFIFNVNPDGGEYDISDSSTVMGWRKNLAAFPKEEGGEVYGVDLNRNYDYKWGCCGGSSNDTSSETYRGSKPFSEPETRNVRDFVDSRVIDGKQQIISAISFHSYSELVLWPMGYTFDKVPSDMNASDYDLFEKWGTEMASRNRYTPMQSSELYVTDGVWDDWMYGSHRIYAFTFELSPVEDSADTPDPFYPADTMIKAITSRNTDSLLYFIETSICLYSVRGNETAAQLCADGVSSPGGSTSSGGTKIGAGDNQQGGSSALPTIAIASSAAGAACNSALAGFIRTTVFGVLATLLWRF